MKDERIEDNDARVEAATLAYCNERRRQCGIAPTTLELLKGDADWQKYVDCVVAVLTAADATRPSAGEDEVERIKAAILKHEIYDGYDRQGSHETGEYREFTIKPLEHLDEALAERAARDYAEIAISAMKPVQPVGGWRDIKDAPHETLLLLGWHDETFNEWTMEVAMASFGKQVKGYQAISTRSYHGRATHYMPLPTAPNQTGEGGGND